MCREGPAGVDEFSSLLERLVWRQRFLRHRLDAISAIWQWPAQRVSRPCLTSATLSVPISLCSRHAVSLPEEAEAGLSRLRLFGACWAVVLLVYTSRWRRMPAPKSVATQSPPMNPTAR